MVEVTGDDAGDERPDVERYWRLSLVFVGLIVVLVVTSTQHSELRSRFYCYIAASAAAICSLTCLTSWRNWTCCGNRADDADTLCLRTELAHLQRPVAAKGSPTSLKPTAYLAMGSAPPWVPPGLPTPGSLQAHHGLDGLADPAVTPLGAFSQFAQGVDPGGPLFGVSTPGMALPTTGLSPAPNPSGSYAPLSQSPGGLATAAQMFSTHLDACYAPANPF